MLEEEGNEVLHQFIARSLRLVRLEEGDLTRRGRGIPVIWAAARYVVIVSGRLVRYGWRSGASY
jgi:hypothetical protein